MFAPVYGSYSNIAGKQEEIEMFRRSANSIRRNLERTSGTGCGK